MKKGAIEAYIQSLGFDSIENPGVEHIDDRKYKFSFYLLNQDGNTVRIRRGAIDELVIEDDILDWYHKGYVTFLNPEDVIERANVQKSGDRVHDRDHAVTPYRFRGDCRDFIYLIFEPAITDAGEDAEVTGDLNSSTYTMKFLFTIYAIEDIQVDSGKRGKMQKLYFHDYRYQMLREKNIYYSTGKNFNPSQEIYNQRNEGVGQLSNSAREKNTGEIVQDILSKSLLTADTASLFSYHWDFGGRKMFYTSPANSKAIDDLDYILSKHVSNEKYKFQPCIFRLERFTERWELLPLSEYFLRSQSSGTPGPYQSEHFFLSFDPSANAHKEIPPERKTFGLKEGATNINYHFPDLSVIDDYTFSEISGVDCQEILNSTIMHRYDKGDKMFNIDIVDHNINTVKDAFQTQLIDHTYGGDSGHGSTSWLTDPSRSGNYNFTVDSSWSSDKEQTYTLGRNKSLLAAFLLGNTIKFEVRGETSRKAGRWIALDRNNSYKDNEYEMKVLGQYFVTKVIHQLGSDGRFTNTIIAVKPYFYKQLVFSDDDMLYKDIEKSE